MTVRDVCQHVLEDMGVLAAGETPEEHDLEYVRGRLNRLMDAWNAQRIAVYVDTTLTFTLAPPASPHTIGPSSATWAVSVRPERVYDAAWVSIGNRTPINVRDKAWWDQQSSHVATSSTPTDVYYEKAWPNGNLWFSPVPSVANQVDISVRAALSSALARNATFTFPPGYHDAVVKGVAAECAPAYELPQDKRTELRGLAKQALAVIAAANEMGIERRVDSAGLSGGGVWDYRIGGYR